MKYSIITIILLAAFASHAQTYDSLSREILALKANQEHIQINLSQGHKRFSTGTLFLIGGFATTIAAGIMWNRHLSSDHKTWDEWGRVRPNPVFFCIGAGLLTAGTIIQIDSHKWFARAGRRKR